MDNDFEGSGLVLGDEPIDCSLVELIVAVTDESEDAWEIGDRIDSLLDSGQVQIDSTT